MTAARRKDKEGRNPLQAQPQAQPDLPSGPPLRFDYSTIADDNARQIAENAARAIKPLLRRTAENIWTIGRYANEVKDALEHGQFLEWVEAEFVELDVSVRTIQRWMMFSRNFDLLTVQETDIGVAALLELSRPSTPPEVREAAISESKQGDPVTTRWVRNARENYEETGSFQAPPRSNEPVELDERTWAPVRPGDEATTPHEPEPEALFEQAEAHAVANVEYNVLRHVEHLYAFERNLTRLIEEAQELGLPDHRLVYCLAQLKKHRRLVSESSTSHEEATEDFTGPSLNP